MAEQSPSAVASIRALRDRLRAKLDQNEDFRAWKALEEALHHFEPPTMPRAVELALVGEGSDAKLTVLQNAIDSAANEIRTAGRALSPEDDSPLETRDLA